MLAYDKRILMLGYGAVAQCTLPILVKHIQVPPQKITVMDFEDRREALKPYLEQGVRFVRKRVAPGNLGATLGKYVGPGDFLVDLAWNIDCCELLQWCHDHGVLYVDTSVEVWDPYAGAKNKHPTEKTLYWRHVNIRRLKAQWPEKGPTAVLEHGANPGLISHWTKQGLVDIAKKFIADRKATGPLKEEVQQHLTSGEYNLLAMKLGVKVIHVSERDTQVTDRPKEVDEFVNTWSIEGFREEGITTAEMGWGTHEKWLPPLAYQHADGPRNQICLARMGMNTWVRSWVPDYPIVGMVVRHGEAFTITDHLTVWQDGQAIYRPTVHYAYCPCDCAVTSLHELRGRDYELQPRLRIMTDEITSGEDILGALLMGHAYGAWWTGSSLSIEQSRRMVRHQNATTMQVAISVVSAAMWAIENPQQGVCVPDDLPYEYMLKIARPYLGRNISRPSAWTPLRDYQNRFEGFNAPDMDLQDPWQFKNFLVTENK